MNLKTQVSHFISFGDLKKALQVPCNAFVLILLKYTQRTPCVLLLQSDAHWTKIKATKMALGSVEDKFRLHNRRRKLNSIMPDIHLRICWFLLGKFNGLTFL